MSKDFVLIHGGGGTAAAWELVQQRLHQKGHRTVAMDLPADDANATWEDYVKAVLRAAEGRVKRPVVVGHSAGGFVAPLVCDRIEASELILVAPMIPKPGERFMEYWSNTGHREAQKQWLRELDVEVPAENSDVVIFYHDVPKELHAHDVERGRGREHWPDEPWPLQAWPDGPTRVLACRQDRLFPLPYLRSVARERLGLIPEEVEGGHCALYSYPEGLADRLISPR